MPVLTLDGVLSGGTWMGLDLAATLGRLLHEMERELSFPVDLEFAIDVDPQATGPPSCSSRRGPLSQGAGGPPSRSPTFRPRT